MLVGCPSEHPGDWAVKLESTATCGMSVEDFERLSGLRVVPVHPHQGWQTHWAGRELTTVNLGFPDGRLRWLMVSWTSKMKEVSVREWIDLCDPSQQAQAAPAP